MGTQQRPQQTPYRTPAPGPQRASGMRPANGYPQEPDHGARYGKAFLIILIVTAILLVVGLVTLCIVLLSNNDKDKDLSNDGDQAYEQNDADNGDNDNTPAKIDGVATNPSRTSYNIGNSVSYAGISGINSDYAVLVDLDNFQAIAGINPDTRICPASMTKVMTVLIACENLKSLNDKLTVSQEAVKYQSDHGASGYNLEAGDTLTVKDMLYLIHYRSDTVACLEISKYIAGSEAAFVQKMNDKAKAMGLSNTRFSNSTGLYFEGEEYYTTCREMAAIMAYALENPLAREILTSSGKYYISSGAYKGAVIAPGWLVDRLGSNPRLETVTVKGGKTGYEDVCGACLVTYSVGNSGKQYVQVIVGGGKDVDVKQCTEDVNAIYDKYAK